MIRSGAELDAEVHLDLRIEAAEWGGTGQLRTVTVAAVDVVAAGAPDLFCEGPDAVAGVHGSVYRMWLSSDRQLSAVEEVGGPAIRQVAA